MNNDPGKRKKYVSTSEERFSGDYRRDRDGNLVKLSDSTNPLNFGKYEKFFKEAGSSRSGARSLKQIGTHYNNQAFKEVILPQLQVLNPETDFYYDGNTYKCGGKLYAKGGELTQFNEGGSHSEHPDGGVPQGVGNDGIVNRVEEGETKNNDYIYSDRLKVSHGHLSKFNLPKYMGGKSYAEATTQLDQRFKDREDNASISTKQAFLERLQESQERKKLESEARALGVHPDELEAANELKATNSMEAGGALASAGMGLFSNLANEKSTNIAGSAANYALQGAAAGSVVPGIGTAIGAAAGLSGGIIMGKMNLDAANEEQQTEALKAQGQRYLEEGYKKAKGGRLYGLGGGESGSGKDSGGDDEKTNILGYLGLAAGLAPMIGNIIEGDSVEKPTPVRYARTGRTYLPQYADENKAINVVNQTFGNDRDRIAGAAAGNIGTFRAGILGSSINKALARSNAFSQINEINRGERAKLAADYGMAAKEDTQFYNQELIDRQQDMAAYNAAKAAYRTATYEGLGEIGKTLFGVNQSEDMSSYNIFGNKRKQKEKEEDGNS